MAKSNVATFTVNPENPPIVTIVNADGTTPKVVLDSSILGNSEGSIITQITISTDDTAANKAFLYINDGTTDARVGWVDVAAGAGTDGTDNAVSMLAASTFTHRRLDNNANPYFLLQGGHDLKIGMQNAVTSTKTVWVIIELEDYTV